MDAAGEVNGRLGFAIIKGERIKRSYTLIPHCDLCSLILMFVKKHVKSPLGHRKQLAHDSFANENNAPLRPLVVERVPRPGVWVLV